jgi:hypothetical protein
VAALRDLPMPLWFKVICVAALFLFEETLRFGLRWVEGQTTWGGFVGFCLACTGAILFIAWLVDVRAARRRARSRPASPVQFELPRIITSLGPGPIGAQGYVSGSTTNQRPRGPNRGAKRGAASM